MYDSEPVDPGEPTGPIPPTRSIDLPHDPFVLASWWADRKMWGTLGQRSVDRELAEAAIVCELSRWMLGWMPLTIHCSIMAGASMEQILAATGMGRQELLTVWVDWSVEQRRTFERTGGDKGMSPEESEHVLDTLHIGTEEPFDNGKDDPDNWL